MAHFPQEAHLSNVVIVMFWFRGFGKSFSSLQSFACLRRFDCRITKKIVVKRSLSPLIARRYTDFSKISMKMESEDDCSDFGLESMFDEGLQCCLNLQQKDSPSSKCGNTNDLLQTDGDLLKLAAKSDDQETQEKVNLPSSSAEEMTTLTNDFTLKKFEKDVSIADFKKKLRWSRKKSNKRHMECESAEDESIQTKANAAEGPEEIIKTGEKSGKKNKKRKKKYSENESGEEGDDEIVKQPRKKSPNYFIAIRVSNPAIHSAFKVIQDSIVAKDPLLKPALIPLNTLHITLLVMHLEKYQLTKAIEVLHECQNDLEKIVKSQNTMTFEGLGHFRNEVVFGKLVHKSEVAVLQQAADIIKNSYTTCRLDLELDDKPFKPHLTLMKLSRIPFKKKKKKLRKIPEDVYSSWIDCEFGVECFHEVLLCSMIDKKQEDGFYHCTGSVVVADSDNMDEDVTTTEHCSADNQITQSTIHHNDDNNVAVNTNYKAEDSEVTSSEHFEKATKCQ